MNTVEIERRIRAVIDNAEIEVSGEDCNFSVTIISDVFNGLTPVKRQQMVLAEFSDVLASGALHALTVKALTLEEWNNRSSAGLVQLS